MPSVRTVKPGEKGENTAREYMVPHRAAHPERRRDP